MDPVIFTSSNACDRIAGRTVRNLSAGSLKAAEIVKRIMLPFIYELGNSKKTQRGVLQRICRSVVQRLEEEESILKVDVEQLYSALSTRESYDLRFILTVGSEDEQFIEFVACEAFLTRRNAKVTLTGTDFFVHRHALSRFMQREEKPLTEFFAAAVEPLYCSSVIAPASAFTSSENIALPMGDGMLMGKMTFVDAEEQPMEQIEVVLGHDPSFKSVNRQPSLIRERRCVVELLTYVSDEAMTYTRAELHDKLAAFSKEHGAACRQLLEGLLFPEKVINIRHARALQEAFVAAYSSARELVNSPEWEFFTQTARK